MSKKKKAPKKQQKPKKPPKGSPRTQISADPFIEPVSHVGAQELPVHRTNLRMRRAQILKMQRTHGNASVSSLVFNELVQREGKAKPEPEWSKRLTKMLPGGVGPVAHMDRYFTLLDVYGEAKLKALVNKVYADGQARKFVKKHGVPGLVALADANVDVAKARKKLKEQPQRYSRPSMEFRTQQRKLGEASSKLSSTSAWAKSQAKSQELPSSTSVVGLDPKERSSVVAAIKLLQGIGPKFQKGLSELNKLPPVFKKALAASREAKKYSSSEAREHVLQMKAATYALDQELDAILTVIKKAAKHFDLYGVWGQIEAIKKALPDIRNGKVDANDSLRVIVDQLKSIKKTVGDQKQKAAKVPKSIERIIFVLQYFLALNPSGTRKTAPPTKDEIAKFRNNVDELGEDFQIVFQTGLSLTGYDLFVNFAERLQDQLAVRADMEATGRPTAGLVPTQAEAAAYFTALKKKPNKKVFEAYEKYSAAFFEHRGVTAEADLLIKTLSDIFKQPSGIAGSRLIVCTGYALQGSDLLENAGAKKESYIVAVRASDANIKTGTTLDDAHALARMKRKGKTFFISNDIIVFNEAQGIGPNAVAWTNKDHPMYKGTGKTLEAANEAVKKKLAKKKDQLDK